MLYMTFTPTEPNHWAAFSKSIQLADVTLNRNGHCAATVTKDRALNLDEMDSISVFMREVEREF